MAAPKPKPKPTPTPKPKPWEGDPEDFRIGHLNIDGAIRDELPYLERILVTGSYDIFGVTGVMFSKKTCPFIRIPGYDVIVYPTSYGTTACRGIAVYIKAEFSERMTTAPRVIEGIEMVNVRFTLYQTEQLKITFLYRPREGRNLTCFKNILEERRVNTIIMGDMNINWLEQNNRFPSFGVQQLVTEVTRPASGTAIDHIWITRGIINLLNCDRQYHVLLKDYQNMIDELYQDQQDQQIQLLNNGQPNMLLNRGHGVDPYSYNKIYKISTNKAGVEKEKRMSDHCIIRIALKHPGGTDEKKDCDDDDSTSSSKVTEAQAQGDGGDSEAVKLVRGAQRVYWRAKCEEEKSSKKATYLKTGYLHIGKDTEASNTAWSTLLTNEDFDVFAVTRPAESEDVPGYKQWSHPTSASQLSLFVKDKEGYGDSVKVLLWSCTDTIGLVLHISLSYIPGGGMNRKQIHMLFLKIQHKKKVEDLEKFVQTRKALVKNGNRFLVFANLDISTTSQPLMSNEMAQIYPSVSVTGRYSDLLLVDKQTEQKIGERGAQDVPQSTNQLIWCKLNIDDLGFVKPR